MKEIILLKDGEIVLKGLNRQMCIRDRFTALKDYIEHHSIQDSNPIRGSICRAARDIAHQIGARAIICLLYTSPCLYYGAEVEFQKGVSIDLGPNAPLSTLGRAYFGDYLEGDVSATYFGEYSASGTVAETLNSPLAVHLKHCLLYTS